MGDHTDYSEGFVLPMAVDRECLVAAHPRADGWIRIRSLDVPDDEALVEVAADGSDEPHAVSPAWGRYVAGVARALAERGRPPVGLDAVLASTVPPGSGLSSSAALEVSCAVAFCDAADTELDGRELALACQRGEHLATGVRSGIMDQLTSVAGRQGCVLLIDCRTLELEYVRVPTDVAVLVVHSGIPRTLAATEYAKRRAASREIAERLGVRALRDAPLEAVRDIPLARHVVTENARVHETARALHTGDLEAVAGLFATSHASLRDDYRVSTPELDVLVEALVAAGALGARLTGAGFGGSVVALCRPAGAADIAKQATSTYRAATGREPTAFVCRAMDGAGVFEPRLASGVRTA